MQHARHFSYFYFLLMINFSYYVFLEYGLVGHMFVFADLFLDYGRRFREELQ